MNFYNVCDIHKEKLLKQGGVIIGTDNGVIYCDGDNGTCSGKAKWYIKAEGGI